MMLATSCASTVSPLKPTRSKLGQPGSIPVREMPCRSHGYDGARASDVNPGICADAGAGGEDADAFPGTETTDARASWPIRPAGDE